MPLSPSAGNEADSVVSLILKRNASTESLTTSGLMKMMRAIGWYLIKTSLVAINPLGPLTLLARIVGAVRHGILIVIEGIRIDHDVGPIVAVLVAEILDAIVGIMDDEMTGTTDDDKHYLETKY